MKESPAPHIPTRRGLLAISPILVFLFFYLAVSVIIGDFYKMPIAVALLLGSAWAVVIMHGKPLSERVEIFSRDAGSSNVMYMVWIFILAGAFAALAREIGAIEATVHLALRFLPVEMLIPGLFAAACFISLAIGTSVGTVVALTPLAVELAQSESGNVPFFVAVVLGGAFFGDNLSFISDTTIAATRTQGCRMRDKFRVNLWIALPAAVASLILYVILGVRLPDMASLSGSNPLLVAPYLLIILLALAGLNVTVVLSIGIVVAIILGLCTGHDIINLFGFMGRGIDSVGQLIIITLLAAGMLGLIKAAGGIDYILQVLTRRIRGPRGAQAGIALVVGLVNLCTANNTVAIITVGQLASSLSKRFGVDPRKAASLLDTSSCIVQSLIPYGAQTLLATSLASISPVATWPYLYYPWALAVFLILSVVFRFPRLATISPPVSTNDNTNP
ncbi:Na+/H+ antiporter NhaC family protein [Muribaculum intestinale]|uniref:Na+/H+ antiporter NhaC family protein n=1 Tax=Muribaculum intestinale TaxID=1796646 RepID=A0A4S2FZD6_9BACT|nr:Na+/H+ antiporter NhaC family protein [Muribaculum intestinale]MYM11784.1 Na+/H+ antiporter NhaC family protein [Muribaculum intestinale]ROT10990.1 Na+/H+ antiporter NhaC family protein [Muribaculaceae bacterium Isolate-100 (HZI)]RXE65741.1 Na+/H+ antiporter NhaC family protein [Muribaculaceae bacterium Isolate-007 (NCI)]TGY74884.1 Na+/H+ antiporter NhaC family protein [Muribaculum intestinale]